MDNLIFLTMLYILLCKIIYIFINTTPRSFLSLDISVAYHFAVVEVEREEKIEKVRCL